MLISCVAYENGRKLADIPVEDISEYVKRPNSSAIWCSSSRAEIGRAHV